MSSEVFISYSSQDRDRIIPVVQYLRNSGISVWVDEGNIHAADLWSEQIVQAIADCRVMVVMMSGNSTDSHNVVKEVMLASEQKKPLLPVYLEPAEIPARLQYQMAGIQHLELYGQDEQQVLADLAAGLIKRGISGDRDTVTKTSTIKRHERPKPKANYQSQSSKTAKSTAWGLAVCVIVLLGMLMNEKEVEIVQSNDSKLGRIHLTFPIPDEYPLAKPTDMPFGAPWRMVAISSDGKNMVYVCALNDERYLCLRSISENSFKLLKDSNGAFLPFFSPDSQWVGFLTENKLKKIELSSGLLKVICDAKNPHVGAVWGDDGMIYYGDSEGSFFYKVSENGGEPIEVTDKIPTLIEISDFVSTSSSSGVLFRSPGPDISRGPLSTYYIELSSGKITRLGAGQTPSVYKDFIATIEDGQIRIKKINFDTLKLTGQAKTLTGSKIRNSIHTSQYMISDNDIMIFLSGDSSFEHQLVVLNPVTNEVQPLLGKKEIFGQFSISPDGGQVAVEVVNNQIYDIQILDVARSRLSSFTNTEHNYTPFWNPDGTKLYYTSNREDSTTFELYQYDFNQRKEEKIEFDNSKFRMVNISDVSNNGRQLLCFGQVQTGDNWGLYLIDILERKKIQLTDNNLNEWGAVFSADEKWVAYSSEKDMEGSFAIYLNHFPDMDNEIRISSGGGEEPMWLPDGSSVFYRNGSQWMKVSVKFSESIQVGEPTLFFEGDYKNVWGPSHDTFPDGRILLLKGDEWEPSEKIDVIINTLDATH
ncbi:TIR domain-containing protein [bacterium]|nr:TIR domain-containing protein [bacterium]